MNLPSPGKVYSEENEAVTRQALETEVSRLRIEVQAIRDALAKATAFPVVVK